MDKKDLTGYISSYYAGSCVDGKGIRCVIFFSGCNLNCPFCHNPESLYTEGTPFKVADLSAILVKFIPYLKNGGITLSGGEPFLQAEFCIELIKSLKKYHVDIAIETNGNLVNEELIKLADTLIVDIKNYDELERYVYADFFNVCAKYNKHVKATNLIIEGVNDSVYKIKEITEFVIDNLIITEIDFMPFKKMCLEKYNRLHQDFEYKNMAETSDETIKKITKLYKKLHDELK